MPLETTLLLNGLPQKGLQISAVDAHVGRAVALRPCRQRHLAHHTPIACIAGAQVLGENRNGIQRILQTPSTQNPGDIGAELYTSALGGQVWRPLDHAHLGACA